VRARNTVRSKEMNRISGQDDPDEILGIAGSEAY
jgi:hypothetical protein